MDQAACVGLFAAADDVGSAWTFLLFLVAGAWVLLALGFAGLLLATGGLAVGAPLFFAWLATPDRPRYPLPALVHLAVAWTVLVVVVVRVVA